MSHVTPCLRSWLPAAAIALLLSYHPAYAQSAARLPRSPQPTAGDLTFKVMPLALADPWTPTFRAGAEYRVSAAWGVEASYGLQMRNLGWGGGGAARLNDRYHKLHLEARHYLGGSPFYVAAAGFRVNQQFDRGAGQLYQAGQLMGYSSARVRRAVTGGLLKAGVVLPLDAHWRLDVALGAGMRYGQVRYDARELQPLDPAGYLDYQPECGFAIDWSPTTEPGTFRRPTVAIDIKLGYTLTH